MQCRSSHLDSTSFSVEGAYVASERVGEAAPVPIHLTDGYSRDHRPDLKQFVMNLVRHALQQSNQTLPNQLGKGTQRPTLRWVFQCFMAVHYVVLNGVEQIVNLSGDRHHILQFFSPACRKYYLLC